MFKLTFVTPEKKIVTGQEALEVTVPAYAGELNILPGHAPLITTLEPGILKYKLAGQDTQQMAAISWGYCQVSPEGVNVLAETAEFQPEVNADRSRQAMLEHENTLATETLTDREYELVQLRIKKAQARLNLSQQK
jgi:F-type H+-transporting ATPase subunit epsilon